MQPPINADEDLNFIGVYLRSSAVHLFFLVYCT